jgi:hypothetical protein
MQVTSKVLGYGDMSIIAFDVVAFETYQEAGRQQLIVQRLWNIVNAMLQEKISGLPPIENERAFVTSTGDGFVIALRYEQISEALSFARATLEAIEKLNRQDACKDVVQCSRFHSFQSTGCSQCVAFHVRVGIERGYALAYEVIHDSWWHRIKLPPHLLCGPGVIRACRIASKGDAMHILLGSQAHYNYTQRDFDPTSATFKFDSPERIELKHKEIADIYLLKEEGATFMNSRRPSQFAAARVPSEEVAIFDPAIQ